MALDQVLTAEESGRLVALASAGSDGDGYNRFKGSGSHPHTPHESFAGLTVGRAAELAEEGTITWEDAWTFLDAAERARALTEKYFKVRVPCIEVCRPRGKTLRVYGRGCCCCY